MKLDEIEAKARAALKVDHIPADWQGYPQDHPDLRAFDKVASPVVVLKLIALLHDLRTGFDSAHRVGCICVGCEALARLDGHLEKP